MTEEEPEVTCPVCEAHSKEEFLASQGFVLTAVEAYLNADTEMSQTTFDFATGYDFHVLIGLYGRMLATLSLTFGMDLDQYIAEIRKQINQEVGAHESEQEDGSGELRVPDSDSPEGDQAGS